MTGKFIVIEGLEGAGKSSAVELVNQYLATRFPNQQLVNTREPGGTPLAEEIREIWKQPRQEKMAPITELLMVYACRAQLVETIIKPAIANGNIVIGDRHNLSSVAYQGGGRELHQQVTALTELTLAEFRPDLTIYLDIDPAIGLERARQRGALDRIEQEQIAFFERARECYLKAAKQDQSIVTIDASQAIEDVHSDIRTALEQKL